MEIKELTLDAFEKYGRFVNLVAPKGEFIGASPICFYRDALSFPFTSSSLAVAVTVAEPRKKVVDVLEYHTSTGECFMNIDRDGIFAVCPANNKGTPDLDKLEVFYAPKGVAIYINPGVWHHAPYTLDEEAVHSMVLLPERTYKNDCISYFLDEKEVIAL